MALIDSLSSAAANNPSAWYNQLQPASFRGVAFQIDSSESTFGNATVLREYPFADLPTVFSMGKAAGQVRVSAYVIGDDYTGQRDRLSEALEQTDDGVLVHPTRGSMRVWVVGQPTVKEAFIEEGGVARFDIVFVQAEPRRYPVAPTASQDALLDATAQANDGALDQFVRFFSMGGLPGWARATLGAYMARLQGQVWAVVAAYSGDFDIFGDLSRLYYSTAAELTDLAYQPEQLGKHFLAFFQLPTDMSSSQANGVYRGMQTLFNAGTAPNDSPLAQSPYATATRAAQARSIAAVSTLIRQGATIAAAEAVSQIELDNYDEALSMRQTMNDQITALMDEASRQPPAPVGPAPQAVDAAPVLPPFETMQRLQTAVLTDLQQRSVDLARLTTYTPQTWQPVWYISYRLYGTMQWADEILAMNPGIEHPLLVAPGQTLRVVRHD